MPSCLKRGQVAQFPIRRGLTRERQSLTTRPLFHDHERFTMKQSTRAYRSHFALYGASVATLGAVLLIFSPRSEWLANALWSFSGLMSWSVIETLLHRFVLHGVQPFRRWHAEHHLHPAALICSPTILSASLIFALVSLPALLTAGPCRARAMTFGILVGYFS